jgi:peptide subunit release factor RF-3
MKPSSLGKYFDAKGRDKRGFRPVVEGEEKKQLQKQKQNETRKTKKSKAKFMLNRFRLIIEHVLTGLVVCYYY